MQKDYSVGLAPDLLRHRIDWMEKTLVDLGWMLSSIVGVGVAWMTSYLFVGLDSWLRFVIFVAIWFAAAGLGVRQYFRGCPPHFKGGHYGEPPYEFTDEAEIKQAIEFERPLTERQRQRLERQIRRGERRARRQQWKVEHPRAALLTRAAIAITVLGALLALSSLLGSPPARH